MSVLLFAVSAIAFVLCVSAVRPPLTQRSAVVRPPWMQVMVTNEFAPTWLAAMAAVTVIGVLVGAFDGVLGSVSLVMSLASMLLLVVMIARSVRSLAVMRRAVGAGLPVGRPAYSWRDIAFPYPYRADPRVERIDDLSYAPGLGLDLYRARAVTPTAAPLLVHVHGGSWGGGHRRQQAQPLIRAMARRGWIVAAIDYPLVPEATFPDQVIAIHAALRWFRDNAAELGIDPRAIALTGGSAGAHLASLASLTDAAGQWSQRRPDEPPVAAGVMFYGVYDLLDRHGIRDVWPILSRALIKADPATEPEKFRAGSPIDHIGDGAPPMLVVHGAADSLVPVEESRHFVRELEERSRHPVAFAELPGATHAFDAVPSLRTQNTVAGVASWLDAMLPR